MHDRGIKELTLAICQLFHERAASNMNGTGACAAVYCVSMIDTGVRKEKALAMISDVWDTIERERNALDAMSMKAPRGEDYTFQFSPDAKEAVEADPEVAAMMKAMQARMREALDGVATGRFADVDEAMRSIGATKVDDVDDLDDDDD
jgi:hypothetical protein